MALAILPPRRFAALAPFSPARRTRFHAFSQPQLSLPLASEWRRCAALFSIDSKTAQIRASLPDVDLGWQAVASLVPHRGKFVATDQRVYLIDRTAAKWTELDTSRVASITTAAVGVGDRCWIGTVAGLSSGGTETRRVLPNV